MIIKLIFTSATSKVILLFKGENCLSKAKNEFKPKSKLVGGNNMQIIYLKIELTIGEYIGR